MTAIMDAILNISKRSMMPEWHQLDSSSTMPQQQESTKKKTLKSSSKSFWFFAGLIGPKSGLIFGQIYSCYSVIFPMPKSIFFSQFSEKNSQFQVLRKIENKLLICRIKVGLKLFVQHVYSGFPFAKISVM